MSEAKVRQVAEKMRETLQGLDQDLFSRTDDSADKEPPDGGVLTGFYLVCEWMGNDGKHWITYTRHPDQTQWRSRGLLEEAITDL